MRPLRQFAYLYLHKVVVRTFLIALAPCLIWGLHILSMDKRKWDVFIGVLAAITAILVEQWAETRAQYNRFNRLAGPYTCFGYADENRTEACRALGINDSELQKRLDGNPDLTYHDGATADLRYDGEVNLHITLREGTHDNEWRGDCIMESDTVGIMAWAYTKLGVRTNPWSRNGIKRLSVISRNNSPIICLYSYNNDDRFGRELLIKDKIDTRVKESEWPTNWCLNLLLVCAGIAAIIIIAYTG